MWAALMLFVLDAKYASPRGAAMDRNESPRIQGLHQHFLPTLTCKIKARACYWSGEGKVELKSWEEGKRREEEEVEGRWS